MSEPQEIHWSGKSGTKFQFWIYVRGTTGFKPSPCVYIYAKQTKPHKWKPLYIGQTENINERLTDHEKEECVNRNGATHIHLRIVTDQKSRLAIEKELIEKWVPACNEQYTS